MKDHFLFNINWIGFPKTHRKVSGCYLIGNCYIGASTHIRKRIIQHCSILYSPLHNKWKKNKENCSTDKEIYLFNCLHNNIPIDVTYIDNDPNNEYLMHKKYNITPNKKAVMYDKINKNNGRRN